MLDWWWSTQNKHGISGLFLVLLQRSSIPDTVFSQNLDHYVKTKIGHYLEFRCRNTTHITMVKLSLNL